MARIAYGPRRIWAGVRRGQGDGPHSLGRPETVPLRSQQTGLGAAQIFPQIDDRETAQQLWVKAIGDIGAQQQQFAVAAKLDRVGTQQPGKVRKVPINVGQVPPMQTGQFNSGIVNLQFVPLAQQDLGQHDQWAFPEVIGVGLEAEADQSHPAATALFDQFDRAPEVRLVGAQYTWQEEICSDCSSAWRIRARRSLGRHDPPKAKPGRM